MEILIEILGEIVLEGIVELITNKKISKWIRYPVSVIFFAFYLIVIMLIGMLAIKLWSDSLIGAIIMLAIDVLLITGLTFIVKKVVSTKYSKI